MIVIFVMIVITMIFPPAMLVTIRSGAMLSLRHCEMHSVRM